MSRIVKLLMGLCVGFAAHLWASDAIPSTQLYPPVIPFRGELDPLPFWQEVFPDPKPSKALPQSPESLTRQKLGLLKQAKNAEARADLTYDIAVLMAKSKLAEKSTLVFIEQANKLSYSSEKQMLLNLLLQLLNAQADDPARRSRAFETLSALDASLNRYPRLLASLVVARSQAGFNQQGQKVRRADRAFQAPLELVSRLCQSLSDKEKQSLFRFSTSLWLEVQKDIGPTLERPFRFDCYEKSPDFPVILERLALSTLAKNPKAYEASLILYKKARAAPSAAPKALELDWRIFQLEQAKALDAQDKLAYEEILRKAQRTFTGSSYAPKIAMMTLAYVRQELTGALSLDPKSATILPSRQMWERFRTSYPEASEVKALSPLYVQVLLHFGYRDEGIEELFLLGNDPSMALRQEHSEKALSLACQKFSLDLMDPFAKPLPQDTQDLELLYRLLSQRLALAPQRQRPRWADSLTLALIEAKTKRLVASQKRLLPILTQLPKALYEKAFNLALKNAVDLEQWTQLEILTQRALRQNLKLTQEELATVGLQGLLVLSLEKQIQILTAKKDLKPVAGKMEALIANLGPSPKRNDSLYRLALLHRQNQDYDRTLSTLRRLEGEQLIDTVWKSGLREQGRLHVLRGEFAPAFRAYQKCVQIAPEDQDSAAIWMLLGDLAMAEQKWDDARNSYRKAFPLVSEADQKETILQKLLWISQEKNQADRIAEDLSQWDSFFQEQPRLRALYLTALYRIQWNQGQLPPLDLRKSFSHEDQQIFAVSELLAWIELCHAQARAQKQWDTVKRSLLAKDKIAFTLVSQIYQGLHLDFMKPCAEGAGSSCTQAVTALLAEVRRYRSLTQDLVLGSQGLDQDLAKEREAFLAATATDEASLETRIQELKQLGPIDLSWQKTIAKDAKDPLQRWLWSADGPLAGLSLVEGEGAGTLPQTETKP